MVTNARKFLVLVLTLFFCVSIFVPVATARDAFAPSWLKEGAYVKYEPTRSGASNLGIMAFFNLSNPKFAGTNYTLPNQKVDTLLETNSSSLMWRCESVNATMAKLQVTLDYVGTPPSFNGSSEEVSVQRTAEVYVDLYTRGVYNADGAFLGTTHLWLPANPNNGQDIIIWEDGSEKITTPVTVSEEGKQYTFRAGSSVTIKNNPLLLGLTYDLDTGLGVSENGGQVFYWDPIFASVGIVSGIIGFVSETNIDLGPEHSAIYWNQVLEYSIIPVAVVLLVATLLVKHRKKKN